MKIHYFWYLFVKFLGGVGSSEPRNLVCCWILVDSRRREAVVLCTLPETNSKFAPENWKMINFLLGRLKRPIFRGKLAVSFRECVCVKNVYNP